MVKILKSESKDDIGLQCSSAVGLGGVLSGTPGNSRIDDVRFSKSMICFGMEANL